MRGRWYKGADDKTEVPASQMLQCKLSSHLSRIRRREKPHHGRSHTKRFRTQGLFGENARDKERVYPRRDKNIDDSRVHEEKRKGDNKNSRESNL